MRRPASTVKSDYLDLTMLEPSGLHRHIGFMLRLAYAAVLRDFMRAIEQFKIRPAEYACLLVIHAEPGLNQQRIGQILNIKHSNLVAVINALEGRGFIDRARPPRDRRTNFIYLTKSGTQFFQKLCEVFDRHNQRVVQRIGRRNLATTLNSLQHLAQLGSDPS